MTWHRIAGIEIASLTSFLLTSNIGLLKTQRSRSIENISGLEQIPSLEEPAT